MGVLGAGVELPVRVLRVRVGLEDDIPCLLGPGVDVEDQVWMFFMYARDKIPVFEISTRAYPSL